MAREVLRRNLASNPRLTDAYGTITVPDIRTNLCPAPRPGPGVWAARWGGGTGESSWVIGALRAVWTSPGPSGAALGLVAAQRAAVTEGVPITASVDVASSRRVRINFQWYMGATWQAATRGAWTAVSGSAADPSRLVATSTPPAGVDGLWLLVDVESPIAGDWAEVGKAMIVVGEVAGEYFDGDTVSPDPAQVYGWAGTPGASPSWLRWATAASGSASRPRRQGGADAAVGHPGDVYAWVDGDAVRVWCPTGSTNAGVTIPGISGDASGTAMARHGLVKGKSYAAAVLYSQDVDGLGGTGVGADSRHLRVYRRTAAGTLTPVMSTIPPDVVQSDTLLTVAWTIAADDTDCSLVLQSSGPAGTSVRWRRLIICEGATEQEALARVQTYFDGDQGGHWPAWEGPAGRSPSVLWDGPPDPSAGLRLQLRRILPDGTRAEVVEASDITHTTALSASSQVTCQVSLAVAAEIAAWYEAHPGQPWLMQLERSSGGGEWMDVRNGLVIAYKGDRDDADPSRVMRITCQDYVSWALGGARVGKRPVAVNGGWVFSHPAGQVLGEMLDPIKARGWAPLLGWDWTAVVDSAGVPWPSWLTAQLTGLAFTPPVMMSQVVSQVCEAGGIEWASDGPTWHLYAPGSLGADRTMVRLGGPDVTRAPSSWTAASMYTHLTVVMDGDAGWVELPVPGADMPLGRREAIMSQSGVRTPADAEKLAATALAAAAAPAREMSYEWAAVAGTPIPGVDFGLGDWVTAETATGAEVVRVVEMVLHDDGDVCTVQVVTGDRIMSERARRDKAAGSLNVGGLIGGSGAGMGVTAVPQAVPVAPAAPTVAANVASYDLTGAPVAAVTVSWAAVTGRTDGTGVVPRGYEIATRTALGYPTISWVDGLSHQILGATPGTALLVAVRAVDADGGRSEWSPETTVTPTVPTQVTTAPSAPTLAAGIGAVTISTAWTLSSGAALPAHAVEVRAETATDPTGPWTLAPAGVGKAGQVAVIRATTASTVYARLYWVDSLGRESTRSSVVSIPVAGIIGPDIEPGSIGPDHIQATTLWADEAWLASATAGVLTAGAVHTSHLSPDVGTQLNIAANEAVQILTGAAAGLDQRVGDTEDGLDLVGQSVTFAADATTWTSPGSPLGLRVSNAAVELRRNGVPLSRWDEAGFTAPLVTSPEVRVGGAAITATPTGITIQFV